MANTVIQIRRSSTAPAPSAGSLAAAEPAYSFNSDKLFIGNTAGTGVIEIGGKYWVDAAIAAFLQANTAYSQGNTSSTIGSAAYGQANAAYTQANTSLTTGQAAFGQANTALTTGQAAFLTGNLAFTQANTALTTGQAAFAKANAALPLTGGTISGDLVVTQNLTVSGVVTYANTQTLMIGDNIFVVNADLPSDVAPSEDAGFEVNRGSSSNVALIWNEATDKWTFTNDGTVYYNIPTNTAVETAQTDATNAFAKANTALTTGQAAFLTGNSAYTQANTALTTGQAAFAWANSAARNAFVTIAANGTNVVADSNNDTLTINAGNGIAIIGNDTSDSIDIGLTNTGVSATTYGDAATVGVFAVDAQGRITSASNVAIAISATAITSGTLPVSRGGTGEVSFTENGILYGNTAGALKITSAGTEGQVLQASATGVPQFAMLDGGTFG
jgi:hypothetical protein